MHDKVINKIIAADDLHWCSIDNKYTALSIQEIDTILRNSLENNIIDEKDLYQIVNWATQARVGEILLKNYLENKIKIVGFDEIGDPVFDSKDDI